MDETIQIKDESVLNIDNVKQILDNTGFGVGIYDVNGTILYFNKTALENMDIPESELINKSIVKVFGPEKGQHYLERIQRVVQTGKTQEYEDYVSLPTGEKWFTGTYSPIYNNQQDIIAVQIIADETTKIKQLQQEKDIILKKLNHAMHAAHQGMWEWNLNCNSVFFDDVALKMLGYHRDDFKGDLLKGSWWMDQVHPEDKPMMEKAFQQYISGEKEAYCQEFRMKTKEGGYTWVSSTGMILSYDSYGKPEIIVGIHQDITDRKQKDERLRLERKRLYNLLETFPGFVYLQSPDYSIKYANGFFKKFFGDPKERPCYEVFHNRSEPCEVCPTFKVFESLIPEKWEWNEESNGKQYLIYDYPFQDGDGSQLVLEIGLDITDLKKLEKELKENERKVQRFFDMSSELICEANIDTATFTKINPAFKEVLGYLEEELLSKSFLEFIHPDDIESTQNIINEQLKKGEKVLTFTNRYRCKDGSYVWLDWNSFPVPEERMIYAVARDITDQKKTHDILEDWQNRLKDAEHTARIGHVEWDCIHQKAIWSDVIFELYEQDPALGTPGYDEIMALHLPEDEKRLKEAVTHALETGEPYDLDLKVKLPSGKLAYHHIIGNPIRDEQGNIISIRGTVQDVTIRKEMQNAIKQSEEKYRLIFEMLPVGICTADKKGKIIDINQYGADITGHLREELIGKSYKELPFIDYKMILKILKDFPKIIRGETLDPYQMKVTDKKDNIHVLEVLISPLYDNGKFNGTQVTMHDVTEQHQAKELLCKSEEKFKTLFNLSADALFIHSLVDERIIDVNEETLSRYGYSKEEILDLTIDDLSDTSINSTESMKNQQLYQRIMNGETVQSEWLSKKKNGETLWHLMTLKIVELDGEKRLLAQAKDIDEMVKARNKLAESEKKYRTYINNAPNGVFISDDKGNYLEVNDEASNTTGYSKDELRSMNIMDLIPDEAKKMAGNHFQTLLEKGYVTGDTMFVHKDGSIHWWTINAVKLSDTRFLGFTQDITDRKNMENTLIEKEQSLKKAQAIAQVGSWEWHINENRFEISDEMNNIYGFDTDHTFKSIDEIININIHPEDKQMIFDAAEDIKNGKPGKSLTYRIIREDGSIRWITATPPEPRRINKEGLPEVIIGTIQDITEKKKAQDELSKAHDELMILNKELEEKVAERTEEIQLLLKQKDEFINQLGHDIKNPLGPLINLLPILEKNEADPKQKEIIQVMNRNVSYIKNLVTKTIQLAQLKSPSTGLHYETMKLEQEINDILNNNSLLFDEKNIKINTNIPEGIMIEADKLKLQEVFNNLLNNAVKYSKQDGGNISVNVKRDEESYVFSIKDSGIGMSEEQIQHIFDEFYKADSSRHDFDSSGLGMPITKRIVEMHGGHIWAESEGIGKGSTFYFSLPINKKSVD